MHWESKDGGGGWLEPKWFREDVVAPFTIGRRVDLNLRLRYNIAEGTDLWIVYNEGLDTDRDVLVPSPVSLSRALIVKYSHTFTF